MAKKKNKAETPTEEAEKTWFGAILRLFCKKPPAKIRYRFLDWDKVRTTKDIILVLRSSRAFCRFKVFEPHWKDIARLTEDEIHEYEI